MRFSFQATLTVVLVGALLVLANFVSTRHFHRLDLTEHQQFTLSEGTLNLLANVDDAITIKAIFSTKFPTELLPLRRDVADLLAEIKANGHGLVTVEYEDPADDEDRKSELAKIGVHADPIQIYKKDQAEAVNVYKSIVIYHADKKEVIPSVMQVGGIEYNIAVAIRKLTMKELPTVAFLGFKNGPSTFTDLKDLATELKKLYDVDTAPVTGGKAIDSSIKTVVVVKPKDLQPAEAYQLDQYILGGGHAIFLVDGIDLDLRQNPPTTSVVHSGLDEMLEAYGVKVEPSVVFDLSCETVSVQVRQGVRVAMPYPPLIAAIYQFFNRESPLTSRISKISFPWASPLTLTAAAKKGKKLVELIKSTPKAWVPESMELAPGKTPKPSADELGQRLLAVSLSGIFESAWADKPPPESESGETASEQRKTGTSRILVIGDSDFILPQFRSPGGVRFFLNAVDWMTLDDSLIDIRTKGAEAVPLPHLEEEQKRWFRILVIGLAPLLCTLFGFVRFAYRRRRQTRQGGGR